MRGFRWNSPLGIALIGVIGSISAALIVGIITILFNRTIVVASSQPEPAAAAKLLGHGFASAEGPTSIALGSSASVVLTVSLGNPARAEDVIWRTTPTGQPTVKAAPVGTGSNLQDAKLRGVPIYSEMRARLDAPAFQYLETDWIEKEVRLSASWVWNISPKTGEGTQAATLFLLGPEGSGYESIIQLEIIVLQGPRPTPSPVPRPTVVLATPPNTLFPIGTPLPTSTPVPTPTPVRESLIRVEPSRGPSGMRVTVTGEGFRSFETVNKIEFGGLGALGGRAVNTDGDGNFFVGDVRVPGLDPGIHAVKVEVSIGTNRTSASTSFEVLESGLIGQPTPVADVYAMSDSLLRIFRFDNNTKTWEFNDRREEFADANDLDELISGGVYWFLIDQDVELDVDGILINLTCAGDKCWNLIVWP